ncbi:hypothetical protein TcWFU_007883 [Taenia crassiceps]|uniref:DDE Tnp4 domain-containing protein n=1 Tax=Taenia crassiceps TaxID=6207 RepID=A0ABR4Q785_9CEST
MNGCLLSQNYIKCALTLRQGLRKATFSLFMNLSMFGPQTAEDWVSTVNLEEYASFKRQAVIDGAFSVIKEKYTTCVWINFPL